MTFIQYSVNPRSGSCAKYIFAPINAQILSPRSCTALFQSKVHDLAKVEAKPYLIIVIRRKDQHVEDDDQVTSVPERVAVDHGEDATAEG
jgi:hypothetical protein